MSKQDKQWERIQKKTFTGWCNNHLRKVGAKIEELNEDLGDGILLIKLLEVISGENFPYRYDKKPRMRIQKAGNLGSALKFIAANDVKLVGIGPEDIIDGNPTLILGMVWTIILRWSIQDISMEEMSAKEGLLLWCQRKTKGYKDVNVQNFHFSWQDGLAFCALIHKHRPDLLNFDELEKGNKKQNLQLAFDVAAEHLDIPQLIDPEDIVDVAKPDERSIMTYVAMYFHVFSKGVEGETAARRIGNLVDFTAENDRVKAEYIEGVADLLKWIEEKIVEHDDREFGDSVEDVEGLMNSFNKDYKKGEKPPKAKDKLDLESKFNQLNTKLSMNNRPQFTPPEGHAPADVDAAWRGLEEHEAERQKALNEELMRQRKIRSLLKKFDVYLESLRRWATSKAEFMNNEPVGTTLGEVTAQVKNHELFEGELDFMTKRLDATVNIVNKLRDLDYNLVDDLDGRVEEVRGLFGETKTSGDNRKANLLEAQERLQKIEDKLLAFAKATMLLYMWLENEGEDVVGAPIETINLESVQQQQEEFDAFVAELPNRETDKDTAAALSQELQELGADQNKYSEVSLEQLEEKWQSIQSRVDERRTALEEEVARQVEYEELRKSFAEKAAVAETAIDSKREAVQAVTGTPDEMVEALRSLASEIAGDEQHVEAAGEVADALVAAGITDNKHTNLTIESLRREFAAVQKLVQEKLSAIEQEVLSKDQSNLTANQLAEFRECFDHFDKDKSGSLDRLELGSLLKSLGQDVSLEEGGNLDEIWASLDENQSGTVTFDEFIGYMETILADNDSPDQVIESFKAIAGDKEFITEADLRGALSDEQVAFMLENMPPYEGVEGGLDYKTFCADCYAR